MKANANEGLWAIIVMVVTFCNGCGGLVVYGGGLVVGGGSVCGD